MQPLRGDVVRSADPFKLGEERQRPWLIVNNSSHPFNDEQFLAVAISTKEYEDSIVLGSECGKSVVFRVNPSSPRGRFTRHGSKIW
jgi:hypothetical protein